MEEEDLKKNEDTKKGEEKKEDVGKNDLDKKRGKRRENFIKSAIIGAIVVGIGLLIKYAKRSRSNRENEEKLLYPTIDKDAIKDRIKKYLDQYKDAVYKHYICTEVLLMFDIDADTQQEIKDRYPDYKRQLTREKVEDIIKERVPMDVLKDIMKDITKEEMGVEVEYRLPADYMHLLYEYKELEAKKDAHYEIKRYLNEEDKKKNKEEIERLDEKIKNLGKSDLL